MLPRVRVRACANAESGRAHARHDAASNRVEHERPSKRDTACTRSARADGAMRYGITRSDDESGRERRGARLRGRERQRAAQAFEAGGCAMLEEVNVGREREFGRGQGRRMGQQIALAASLQMGLQALRRRIAGVVAASGVAAAGESALSHFEERRHACGDA